MIITLVTKRFILLRGFPPCFNYVILIVRINISAGPIQQEVTVIGHRQADLLRGLGRSKPRRDIFGYIKCD